MEGTGVAGPTSLRLLLEAVIGIVADLDLSATLRRIVAAATSLVDMCPRYSTSSPRRGRISSVK